MCVGYQSLMLSVASPMSAMLSVSGFSQMYACNSNPMPARQNGLVSYWSSLLRRSSVCLDSGNVASHSNMVNQLLADTWQYNLVRKSAVQRQAAVHNLSKLGQSGHRAASLQHILMGIEAPSFRPSAMPHSYLLSVCNL